MSLVSSVITSIRYEINDSDNLRYTTDTPILSYVKRAVTRANRIVQRNGIQFGKKKATLTTTASVAYVALPADFDVDIGLWRDSDHTVIQKATESIWETIISPSVLDYWYLDLENSRVLLAGTPDAVETLTFYYFPSIDVSSYATTTTMPWGGRLDDLIVEYVALRLKNVDEMEVSMDLQLMTDFEGQILQAYAPVSGNNTQGVGWM